MGNALPRRQVHHDDVRRHLPERPGLNSYHTRQLWIPRPGSPTIPAAWVPLILAEGSKDSMPWSLVFTGTRPNASVRSTGILGPRHEVPTFACLLDVEKVASHHSNPRAARSQSSRVGRMEIADLPVREKSRGGINLWGRYGDVSGTRHH